MSTIGVKFKVMPKDIEVNLKELSKKIKQKIESLESGTFNKIEEEPIAFGLKALIVTFALSEDEEVDSVEDILNKIDNVSSVELIDHRRAIG
tara:strand:+ start:1807 stop:2082 length:276 start_codon:yes stop_codon:yes gene_type:complete